MKNAIMYCFAMVAMAFAMFAAPAMAAEGYEGFAPVAVHADVMPEIVAIDDRPMLAERSARSQPEAVAALADKSAHTHGVSCLATYHTGADIPVTGPFERGWLS